MGTKRQGHDVDFARVSRAQNLKYGVFSVMDYGADPTATVSSSTAFQACIDAALGGNIAAGASTQRTPAGQIYIPAGSYLLDVAPEIHSVLGLDFGGAGREETKLFVTGTFAGPVLLFNGVYRSKIHDFSIIGTGTHQVNEALRLDWDDTKATRSTAGVSLERIAIRNLKYVTGIQLGFTSGKQVSEISLRDIQVSGQWTSGETTWWQNGIRYGNSNAANVYNFWTHAASVAFNRYNYFVDSGGRTTFDGIDAGAAEADFKVAGDCNVSIDGVESQNSQRLYYEPGGAGYLTSVNFRNVVFKSDTPTIAADKKVVLIGYGGPKTFENVSINYEEAPLFFVSLSSGSTKSCQLTTIGMRTQAAADALVTVAESTNSKTSLVHINYTQAGSDDAGGVRTPLYVANLATASGVLDANLANLVDGFRAAGIKILGGSATPEGAVTAPVGSVYFRSGGGAGTVLYMKETGSGNTGWVAYTSGTPTAPDIQFFSASGTWTKPAGTPKVTHVYVCGGGGGGASGRRGASGTVCGGGGGGAPGYYIQRAFETAELGSTETVTIGSGGSGGAAQTTNDTNGVNGGAGGATSFGTKLAAPGNSGNAIGGSTTGGAGGSNPLGLSQTGFGAGAPGGTGAVGGGCNPNTQGAGSGGGGGGISTTPAAFGGGAGGGTYLGRISGANGVGGLVDSTAPTGGTASATKGAPGPGGGGGAASITTTAQAGANAVNYGGGGGGGGASLNGNNSGAGGNGAGGFLLAITFYQ